MIVEDLYEQWKVEEHPRRKERILLKIFNLYENLVNKYSRRYQNCTCNEVEDWRSIVQQGILAGLHRASSREDVRKEICNRAKFYVTKELQHWNSKARRCPGSFVDFETNIALHGYHEEENWVTKTDIELAISKLPPLLQKTITLWMKGLPVMPDRLGTCVDGYYSICEAVNLKDAAVYFKIQDCFAFLRSELQDYNSIKSYAV